MIANENNHDHSYTLYKGVSVSYDKRKTPYKMSNPHHHSDYELFFLVKGENYFYTTEDDLSLIGPNSISFIKPGTLHQSSDYGDTLLERYTVYISASLVDEIASKSPKNRKIDNMFLTLDDVSQKIIYENILRLRNEISIKDNYSPMLIKSIVSEIILILLRNSEDSIVLNSNEKRIQSVVDYIETHYAENITLEACAKTAYMSSSHFSRQFKKITGDDFKSYLINTRMKNACHLLEEPDGNNITNIAFNVGFSDCSYFTKTFKKVMGITPLQYHKAKCADK